MNIVDIKLKYGNIIYALTNEGTLLYGIVPSGYPLKLPPLPNNRKIIKFEFTQSDAIVALANDGTMWEFYKVWTFLEGWSDEEVKDTSTVKLDDMGNTF
jgi:hypothetical protein